MGYSKRSNYSYDGYKWKKRGFLNNIHRYNLRDKFQVLLPLAILFALTLLLVNYSTTNTKAETLENAITNLSPVFLFVNFSVIVLAIGFNYKEIRRELSKVSLQTWIILALIFSISFFLRAFIAPRTTRLFFDEDIYLDIGKEILINGKGALCNYGYGNECYEYDLMKWPNGYPFLVAVAYLLFGISTTAASNLSIVLSSLTPVLMFLMSYLITRDDKISLYSALLFSLIPIHIMWSSTTATSPAFTFFTLFAAVSFFFSFRDDTFKSQILAMSTLAYAMQIRSEGVLLLPIFGIMTLVMYDKFFTKVREKKFLLVWVLFFILLIPYLVHMNYASQTEAWGSDGKKFSFEYAQVNIPTNLIFWIHGYETIGHPVLFTIFAVIGAAYVFTKDKRTFTFMMTWFILFFFVYAFFYAGSVKYGVDVRYTLIMYPPFIFLSSIGANLLTQLPKKRFYREVLNFGVIVLIFISFVQNLPSISTPSLEIEEAKQARSYREFVISEMNYVDDDCYIMSHVPSIFLVMGKGSLQVWNGQDEKVMDELFNKTDCIIFDDGYWCHVEPYKSSVCKTLFDDYKLEQISILNKSSMPEYAIYNVSKKSG